MFPTHRASTLDPPGHLADAAMARYARGDNRAFAAVYAHLAPGLRGWLARRLRHPASVDDLVQETFLRIHRHRGCFTPGGRVWPWALSIAQRLFIDRLRREVAWGRILCEAAPSADCADPGVGPEQWLHAVRLAEAVERALVGMTPLRRAAFRRVRLEGESLGEVAAASGMTVVAVKSSVCRAAGDLSRSLDATSMIRRRARRAELGRRRTG